MNVLLDRDGTLIEDRRYLSDSGGVRLYPGVGPALRSLMDLGCRLFLVTNQSGIGRGLFTSAEYGCVHERLQDLLAAERVYFTDHMFCPHAPEDRCLCRKPGTGLWDQLRERHGLLPEQSLMIGDKPADVQFAGRAGLACAMLVLSGYGRNTAQSLDLPQLPGDSRFQKHFFKDASPCVVARDLPAACDCICRCIGPEARA
ncbi:MAG: HAD-IIIA family hydrolase [Desulfohalobiaceae bacterium]|nr:HAD-IIIA family hydrolase [Desulfohalobiaceae bacterium]